MKTRQKRLTSGFQGYSIFPWKAEAGNPLKSLSMPEMLGYNINVEEVAEQLYPR